MTALRSISTGVLAATLAMVGCQLNEQIDLTGTATPLPALADGGGGTELNARPSLMHGLDRQSWSTVKVQVPRDQVTHYPTYAINFRWQKEGGPWNPAYPAPVDTVVDPIDVGADAADAIADPFVAGAMLVWAPIDMLFFTHVWEEKRSPTEPYALVPDRASAHLIEWFNAPSRPRVVPPDDTQPDTPPGTSGGAPSDRGQPHP